jgi:hypothetical protein
MMTEDELKAENDALRKVCRNAANTLTAIYAWVDRVEANGGATCISGVAECNAMLKSLNKNRGRVQTLVLDPLNKAGGL